MGVNVVFKLPSLVDDGHILILLQQGLLLRKKGQFSDITNHIPIKQLCMYDFICILVYLKGLNWVGIV